METKVPKISDRPLTKICVRLWSDDYDYLTQKSRENPETPFNFLVRNIVTTFVRQMRATENRMIDQADINLERGPVLTHADLELLRELETEEGD
jgi:hypothetical protein